MLYKHIVLLFKILIVVCLLLSFYILFHKVYNKNYKFIHSWHFPTLCAVCIETFATM